MKVFRFPVRVPLLILLMASTAAVVSGQTAGNRLIITQVYGGGGNSTSYPYQHDWVELYNNSNSDIDLGNPALSLQYASDAGAGSWTSRATLVGIIKAQHFFLVELGGSTKPGATDFATPDLIRTPVTLSATAGRIAVVVGTPYITTTCPASFITLVGYGATAICSESGVNGSNVVQLTSGSPSATDSVAPGASSTNSLNRNSTSGVFLDDGNNHADFISSSVNPRNSSLSYVWTVNGKGTVNKYDGTGTFTPGNRETGPHGSTSTTATLGGMAVDSNGNAWSVTLNGTSVYSEMPDGSSFSKYTVGGVSNPAAVAVDGLGNVWVVNSSTNSVTELTNTGAAISPNPDASGTLAAYANGGFSGQSGSNTSSVYGTPHGVAVDLAGNVWVSNSSANTIVQIVGAAAPAAPLSIAVLNSTTGVRP